MLFFDLSFFHLSSFFSLSQSHLFSSIIFYFHFFFGCWDIWKSKYNHRIHSSLFKHPSFEYLISDYLTLSLPFFFKKKEKENDEKKSRHSSTLPFSPLHLPLSPQSHLFFSLSLQTSVFFFSNIKHNHILNSIFRYLSIRFSGI